MKTFFLGLALVGLGTLGLAADDPAKGSHVTLRGCVAASDSDSFVLTHVQNLAGPGATTEGPSIGATGVEPATSDVIYWLSKDSIKRMRGHVGHKVEVKGTVTDVSTGTVEVKKEPGKPGPDNKVEVDARGKDASARTDRPVEPGPAPAAGSKVEKKMVKPVHRIDVDTVTMVAATCP
jgi:hypothetical protein